MQRGETDRTLAEIAALRQEIAELRAEQRALAEQVSDLARAFHAIATQIGIASEPYRSRTDARDHDPAGFA